MRPRSIAALAAILAACSGSGSLALGGQALPPAVLLRAGPGTPRIAASAEENSLEAFSDVAALWGHGAEAAIEEAYRECFRTVIVGGRLITLRIPFGQNNERSELAEGDLEVLGGGKADPAVLWKEIELILASPDFARYVETLGDGREKALVFDLERRTWAASRDLFLLARLKAGAYPGLPHKPVVYQEGKGVDEGAVYDYLYAVGRLGMDCSGFVWHGLTTVAERGGLDLGRALRRQVGVGGPSQSLYVGSWFFHPANRHLEVVKEEIRNLRPGDVIVFRDAKGAPVHSALIQSIDFEAGRVRYLQSTDEAPRAERGIHESFILFDPGKPETSLKDPSLIWTQARKPAFDGEPASPFRDDGERYRAFPEIGGGTVVRLKALQPAMDRLAKKSGR